jgi:MFS family permease
MPLESKPDVRPAHGWIVLTASFFTLTVMYGVWYSYSVFLVALLREFGWPRSVVAGAFSTFVFVHGLVAPGIGWLVRRFGPRRLILTGGVVMCLGLLLTAQATQWWHLYLAFGVVAALGMGLGGWVPTVMLARGWFPSRVATAVGITSGGIGIGILGLVPVAQWLIDHVGWRWAYRVLGALVIAYVVPAAMTLIEDPPPGKESAGGKVEAAQGASRRYWTLAAAVKSRRFWYLGGVYFTGNFVTQMLMIHQVAYLVDHGVAAMTAAEVAGGVGFISILAKIGWGALADRSGRELAYGLAFGCTALSLGALVLAGRYHTAGLLLLYVLLVGLGYAIMAPIPPAAASDMFGGPGFSTIFGTLYSFGAMGLAGGTWSAGRIFDLTGSYAGALWLGLGMAALSPMLLWMAAPRRENLPTVTRIG